MSSSAASQSRNAQQLGLQGLFLGGALPGRITVAGTRHLRPPVSLIGEALRALGWPAHTLLCGCCGCREDHPEDHERVRTPDTVGALWAQSQGLAVEHYPAPWRKHGKAAGPLRNGWMHDLSEALLLLWDGHSAGSRDILSRFHASKKPYAYIILDEKRKRS